MADLMTCDGRFTDEESGYSLVFDDDGRVAYAYLQDSDGRLVGDAWLYNRGISPTQPEWKNPENMPFMNPVDFVNQARHDEFRLVESILDVRVDWSEVGEKVKARVLIRNEPIAILLEGAKPGWCLLAGKDGPLARVLEL